jgi:hypothetical protein
MDGWKGVKPVYKTVMRCPNFFNTNSSQKFKEVFGVHWSLDAKNLSFLKLLIATRRQKFEEKILKTEDLAES